MAIALLQSASKVVIGTSTTLAFPSNVTPGSLLVAYQGVPQGGTPTISDNVNGSYNRDIAPGGNGIWTFPNAAGGATTITYTYSISTSLYLILEEWSGVQTVSPLDKTASNSGTATSGNTGTTATLAQAQELSLAILSVGPVATTGTATISSPYTASPEGTKSNSAGQFIAGYLITSATTGQSASFTWTNSIFFRSGIATYQTVSTTNLAPLMTRKYVLFNT